MIERCSTGTSTIMVARSEGMITGMIEFRGADHVALMFVAGLLQRRGIARTLFDAMRAHLATKGDITVNSSRYAVPVYESLGFSAVGPEQTVNGITFTPMSRAAE